MKKNQLTRQEADKALVAKGFQTTPRLKLETFMNEESLHYCHETKNEP